MSSVVPMRPSLSSSFRKSAAVSPTVVHRTLITQKQAVTAGTRFKVLVVVGTGSDPALDQANLRRAERLASERHTVAAGGLAGNLEHQEAVVRVSRNDDIAARAGGTHG